MRNTHDIGKPGMHCWELREHELYLHVFHREKLNLTLATGRIGDTGLLHGYKLGSSSRSRHSINSADERLRTAFFSLGKQVQVGALPVPLAVRVPLLVSGPCVGAYLPKPDSSSDLIVVHVGPY